MCRDAPSEDIRIMKWTNGGATPAARAAVRAANDNRSMAGEGWRCQDSALPADITAVIEPADCGASHAGRARKSKWRLWFRPRVGPSVDSLTGWSGGSDPMAALTLTFRTLGDAIGYCRRYGIDHDVRGLATRAKGAVLPWPTRPLANDRPPPPTEKYHAHGA
jgi:hypothetical protein